MERNKLPTPLVKVQHDYTTQLSQWNVPGNSFDAIHADLVKRYTYFFKGQTYYRLEDNTKQVHTYHPRLCLASNHINYIHGLRLH